MNEDGGPDNAGSVTVYPPSSNGDVTPSATIADTANSANTGFSFPSGMTLDGSANIYVTNDGSAVGGNDTVTVYPAGSNGNVSPSATISGAATQLILPYGIAVDSHGNIYLANDGSVYGGADSIAVYPSGSNGNAAPTATISGSSTELSQPALIALTPGS